MNKYSDLLIEASQLSLNTKKYKLINNVSASEFNVLKEYENVINRKCGKYISLFPDNRNTQNEIIDAVFSSLIRLNTYCCIDLKKLLVIGLGNKHYIVDALGNMVVEKINVKQNSLLAFSPKVNSQTGIESHEIIKAITAQTKPDLVLIIDSIVTSEKKRLANCYQLTTAGIAPGGGINNIRNFIDSKYLSTPIIAIGVPVILASSLGFLAPYNIEDALQNSSQIISAAINKFF